MHVVMALLQMQFSTSFFDSQEHLLIHLVQQVKLVGLVQAWWIFFIERYLKTLEFVRQITHPEGSMVEGYLVQEAMGLCHDIIGDLDAYAQAWKYEQDLHIICNFFYKSHANLISSLFIYLNSFSSIPLNENKGSLVNVVPKIEFMRFRQMICLYSCGMKVFTHDSF